MLFAWSACRRTHGDLLNWLALGFLWSLLPFVGVIVMWWTWRRASHEASRRGAAPRERTGVGVVRRAAAAPCPAPTPSSRRPRWSRCPDLPAAIGEALAAPVGAPRLRELARGARSVVVTIPDASRPCPSEPVLLALLEELDAAGVPDDAVTVAIGCGLHATTGDEERARLAGAAIAARVEVIDAQGIESETADLGRDLAGRSGADRPARARRPTSSSPSASSSRTSTPASPAASRAWPSAAPGARPSPGRTARRSSRSRA